MDYICCKGYSHGKWHHLCLWQCSSVEGIDSHKNGISHRFLLCKLCKIEVLNCRNWNQNCKLKKNY